MRKTCNKCKQRKNCIHNKEKRSCRECGGASLCIHNKRKGSCRECGGSSFCIHNKQKHHCKECGGASICEHDKIRSQCKECGGASICEHDKIKFHCRECKGGSYCHHDTIKYRCKVCEPLKYLVNLQRNQLKRVLRQSNLEKAKPSIEYLGCSVEYFKNFIEKKMTKDMTWDNIHLDHIKPITKFKLDDEDQFLDCCNYTNFQPLLVKDNLEKNNKWNKSDDDFWVEYIKGKEYIELYFPI
jgi:hypothetical protein